ncbi:MAG: hypothetical protein QOE72_1165 [Chloroflexota bacterium]|jgi:hypothetical protein|nr:hypothetical protein [Chloroflexota bacterium]
MADWFVQAHHHCPALPPCHSSAGLMEVGVGVVDPDADTDFETGQVADGRGVGEAGVREQGDEADSAASDDDDGDGGP